MGSGFFEQEAEAGILEGTIVAAHPKKKVIVRNLGWSGDTVWAESRGLFDAPEKGYARMLVHIDRLKPTLVLLAYGTNESEVGAAGVEKFKKQYRKLISDLRARKVRMVLFSPVLHEKHAAPLPDPARRNAQLLRYSKGIHVLAVEEKIPFVDLTKVIDGKKAGLTFDSHQLNEAGYQQVGISMAKQLGWKDVSVTKRADWRALQKLILKKNQLYFYRWRPQNITYLTLFRKREQGNNAKEIPMFDPLVESLEGKIFKLLNCEKKRKTSAK